MTPILSLEVVPLKFMVGLLGKPDARAVDVGNPDMSELLGQMKLRGSGQMPLTGSHRIDVDGVALIREWILSLGK